ncbi:hypothetical protein PCANC_10815 [Puccinia coronata f. sp. avenae]|uniref:Uncharacterized protein n=1 Tax=Puccinia coronata f. sp. avenae TaxID=200324 RepID=A0A2N5V4M6_9BASI|nr:hypothetical protein PCANC_10815 [Puccinia coronata f. sp. avenae]
MIGNPAAKDDQFEIVESIHESLGNADQLCYYRRHIIDELEKEAGTKATSSGEDKFLFDMFEWDQ